MRVVTLVLAVFLLSASVARAQSFEVGGHFASSQWSEFDGADNGFGARFTWKPSSMVGVDAELTWYETTYPDEFGGTPGRLEGLFGVTVGPRMGRVRPFAKAAAGFLKAHRATVPRVCIAIFPPPLSCVLAQGHTMPALDIGGGVEFDLTSRTFIRTDLSYRLLKYPGPTLDADFQAHDEGFFGGGLRFTFGAGFKF